MLIRSLRAALAACLVLLVTVGAAPPARADGVRPEAIDAYLAAELAKARVPGAAVQVVSRDAVLLDRTYGDVTGDRDAFVIGSLTKSLTALAVLQLVDAGSVELDAPAARYLPELGSDAVTVRQLLNQTSGYGTNDTPAVRTVNGRGEFRYANVNYTLLGRIVASVSGVPYEAWLRDRVFAPLGMRDSGTADDAALRATLTPGYRSWFGLDIAADIPPPVPDTGWVSIAAGYAVSTAPDMGRYLQALLRGDALSAAGMAELWRPAAATEHGHYAMGWLVREAGGVRVLVHDGLVENYATTMVVVPERNVAAVVLTDRNDFLVGNAQVETIGQGVIALLVGQEPPRLDDAEHLLGHALVDAALLALLTLALASVARAGRTPRRPRLAVASGLLLNLALPGLLIAVPLLVDSTWDAVRDFVPDVYWVLVAVIPLLVGGGLGKLVAAWRRRGLRSAAAEAPAAGGSTNGRAARRPAADRSGASPPPPR